MGWKKTNKNVNSFMRSVERASRKRQSELAAQQRLIEKMDEFEKAKLEVQIYENDIEVLLSLHKECGSVWDWELIQASEPPNIPSRLNTLEELAKSAKDNYKPTGFDKLFNQVKVKQEKLIEAVAAAALADNAQYEKEMQDYEGSFEQWKLLSDIAERINKKDIESYIEAIKLINPLDEIDRIGSDFDYLINNQQIEVLFNVDSDQIIPSETKSLLKSGKVSIKETPKSRLFQLHQDYVCSAALRVAREIFALLPVEYVLVTVTMPLLNSQTGHKNERIILSVLFSKKTLDSLNFETIDPSDAMKNFIHNMDFNRNRGFSEINRISFDPTSGE